MNNPHQYVLAELHLYGGASFGVTLAGKDFVPPQTGSDFIPVENSVPICESEKFLFLVRVRRPWSAEPARDKDGAPVFEFDHSPEAIPLTRAASRVWASIKHNTIRWYLARAGEVST